MYFFICAPSLFFFFLLNCLIQVACQYDEGCVHLAVEGIWFLGSALIILKGQALFFSYTLGLCLFPPGSVICSGGFLTVSAANEK